MRIRRIVLLAAAFAAVVTIYSLRQLQALTEVQEGSQETGTFPTHTDWRMIASRAVQHVEHLPHHPFRSRGHEINTSGKFGSIGHHLTPTQEAGSSQSPDSMALIAKSANTQDSPKSVASGSTKETKALPKPHDKEQTQQQDVTGIPESCHAMPNAEFWGDVVVSGRSNKQPSAAACCDACKKTKGRGDDELDCNVWVYCGDKAKCEQHYQECWLKYLAHPDSSKPVREGPEVPWTSGVVGNLPSLDRKPEVAADPSSRKFHIVTSASGMATHWQVRIHYWWYKKLKAQCEAAGPCEMGGFTRLLHSGKTDDLMEEIPTFVADPLPHDVVEHSWYVVLNRPYAFAQWVNKAVIPEKYVLMSEPDHIFIRPLPNFMTGDTPAAFPFFYIEPSTAENAPITQKFTGKLTRKELDSIAPIGNSPTYMTVADMKRVMPIWMNMSVEVFKDHEANTKWGWVQEMYAFTISVFKSGIRKVDTYMEMMAQPPWDSQYLQRKDHPFYILHYTYGMDYTLSGVFTPGKYGEWRWDKRTFATRPPPRHLGAPPKGVTNELVKHLISSINEATANIPCWDDYVERKVVITDCEEARSGRFNVTQAAVVKS